jgi:uncharacterized protein YqhQ
MTMLPIKTLNWSMKFEYEFSYRLVSVVGFLLEALTAESMEDTELQVSVEVIDEVESVDRVELFDETDVDRLWSIELWHLSK